MSHTKPMMRLQDRRFGDRHLVALDRVKLLSKPTLEIRKIKGIDTPQHFGVWAFEVENLEGTIFKIHIGADTRVENIGLISELTEGELYDFVIHPLDWQVGERAGTKLYFRALKES